MALASYLKIAQKFTDSSLIEMVSGDPFTASGNIDFLGDGKGVILTPDASLSFANASVSLANEFFVAFWLQPRENRKVQNPSSGIFESMSVSLFNLGPYAKVFERTLDNGENRIVMQFANGNEVTSTPYSVNNWHHFGMLVSSGSGSVYVDGQDATDIADAPPAIVASTISLTINQVAITPSYATINNTCYLADFVLANDATALTKLARLINYGIEYAFDDYYDLIEEFEQPLLFDDPASARVTGVLKDVSGSYLYLSRSDGKLLKGSPKFWDVRRDFSDAAEQTVTETSGTIAIENGALKITSGFISL